MDVIASFLTAAIFIALLIAGWVTLFGFTLRFRPGRPAVVIVGATYIVSLATLAAVAVPLVFILAGPHSDMLPPGPYSQLVGVAALLALLVLPGLAVYKALQRRNTVSPPG